jgi:hypothetical protein
LYAYLYTTLLGDVMMRTTRLAMACSAIVLMSSVGTGCTIATQSAPEGFRADQAVAQTTPEERRQMRDSAAAQEVADEVGPRVTVRADFDYAGGSRQVQATFHMYDDAYVIVGHLDAAGRLKIVFPSEPGDDGFVRGDKVYHVPSFFAGFADEYAWRQSDYRTRYHSVSSRRDSYDAGLGYVFVIASWRPMRLDRITDGNHWETYNVSDVNYMSDPREAVEELGSVIAGDNSEAYTIEYAQYTTTNYGTYSFADFDRGYGSCLGYGSGLAFQPFSYFSPFAIIPTLGFGYAPASCGYAYSGYGYPYGYGYAYGYGRPGGAVPPISGIPGYRHGAIATPLGLPQLHLPRVEAGPGALTMPPVNGVPGAQASASRSFRPGLIAEDAGGRRLPGERQNISGDLSVTSRRPTIQQMIGTRRIDDGLGLRNAGRESMTRGDNPSWSSGRGISAPRASDSRPQWHGGNRASGASESGRSSGTPSRAGGESTRSTPSHATPSHVSPPHGEATRSAPAHSEPARSAPPASSSSGSKKP